MRSLLTISLAENFEVVVERGKNVRAGEILARKKSNIHKEKIPLTKILEVKPKDIASYLTKRLGTQVKKGEVIAHKKSLLKNIKILSPVSGIIDSVDLKEGTLLFITKVNEEYTEVSPVSGIIEGVTSEEITLSFKGKVLEAEKGKGEKVIGKAVKFPKHVDMLDFSYEVNGKIVIGKTFTDSARAKLKTIGATALVALEYYEDFPAAAKLADSQLKELLLREFNNLIVIGDKRKIIIPVELLEKPVL